MRGKLIALAITATLAVVASSAASASTAAQSMPVSVLLSKPQLNKPVAGKTTFIVSVNKLKGRSSYKYVLYVGADYNAGQDLPVSFPAYPHAKMFRHNYIFNSSSSKPFRLKAIVSNRYACFGFSIFVVNGSHPWISTHPTQYCKPPAG
ncbi:hypothetical protein KW789_02655 [Candidatus Saccharibacteria bacterium]|jgi:hypothetical protein|nr:hypothetical protein [Candidatus Saccharibacteria bacterium]